MKVGIIGGTGLIGQYLAKRLSENDKDIIVYSRGTSLPFGLAGNSKVKLITMNDPNSQLEGLDVLLNLAGESILGGRWTEERKKQLWSSRVDYSKKLIKALSGLEQKPKLFLSGSAIGYYGLFPEKEPILTENSNSGSDYLAKMCIEWENAAMEANHLGIITRLLRIGIVLSKEGGALRQMLPPFQLGIGGPIGGGKQYMSWIHIEDFYQIIEFLISYQGDSNIFNLTAPKPVSNEEFSKILAKTIHRPCLFRVPGFALNLLYGESSIIIKMGLNVLPENLLKTGFKFKFTELKNALDDLLN